jgi:hypothetical protein
VGVGTEGGTADLGMPYGGATLRHRTRIEAATDARSRRRKIADKRNLEDTFSVSDRHQQLQQRSKSTHSTP